MGWGGARQGLTRQRGRGQAGQQLPSKWGWVGTRSGSRVDG